MRNDECEVRNAGTSFRISHFAFALLPLPRFVLKRDLSLLL